MNSIKSLKKYSDRYEISLINLFGEWENYRSRLINVNFINFFLSKYFPIKKKISGFLKSRVFYFFLGIISIFELYSLLKRKKPDYIIVHLITSVPLILLILFKFDTKFILRISGFPKLNLFRKCLWRLASKKVDKIFCPTSETSNILKSERIFDDKKIYFLEDPIIQISKINKEKNDKIDPKYCKKKYILAIGRLSNQKNFSLLIKFFKKISENDKNLYLLIAGEGEQKSKIENLISSESLQDKVELLGFEKNIYKFLKYCHCFISTSLWEDPGFVIVEAAATNAVVISSNCSSGPKEILSNGKGGFLFKNNDLESLIKAYQEFNFSDQKKIFLKKVNIKKKSKNYTFFNHFKKLNYHLSN